MSRTDYLANPVALIEDHLILPHGPTYGECVAPFQREFFNAIFATREDDRPEHRLVYSERRRGESKTEDCAAAAIADLLTGPPGHRSYAVAASSDQAALLLDSISGFRQRVPALQGLEVERARVINSASDSRLIVLSAEDRTAFGVRPRRVYFDELSLQPDDALWNAMWTAVGKSPTAQMVAVSMAGSDFTSVGWRIRELARETPGYWFQSREGSEPAPWLPDLEEQRLTLHPADFSRFWAVTWTEPEGSWISREMWDACEVGREGIGQARTAGCVGAVDVGLVHDATAIAVCHREGRRGEERVILDTLDTLQGSRREPVELEAIEDTVADLTRRFHVRTWRFEAPQAVGSVQRLQRRLPGVRVESRFPTVDSMARLFGTVYRLVANRQLVVFPHERLRREALNLHLRQVGGRLKVVDSARVHQDHVVALGIAADLLMEGASMSPDEVKRISATFDQLREPVAAPRRGFGGLGMADGGSSRGWPF